MGRRLVLRSIAWPNVKSGVPGGVQGGDRAGDTSTKLFGFVRGSLNQALFDAAIPPSFRRGDVGVLIAQQQLNLAIEEQLHGARLSFYSALYHRELLSVRQHQREHLDENVASQSERYRAGLVDRGAFTTATMEVGELDPLVESARRGYNAAQLQLSQEMGVALSSEVVGLPSPEGQLKFTPVDVDLDREIAAALERRTDINSRVCSFSPRTKTNASSPPVIIRARPAASPAITFRSREFIAKVPPAGPRIFSARNFAKARRSPGT